MNDKRKMAMCLFPVRASTLAAVIMACWLVAGPAFAQTDEIARRTAQQEKLESEARAIGSDMTQLQQRLVTTAKQIREQEQVATDHETQLETLQFKQHALTAGFDRRQGELSEMLGVLTRVSQRPPALLMVEPDGVRQQLRGTMLLGAMIRLLEQDAAQLRAELAELDQLRATIVNKQDALQKLLPALHAEKQRLSALLEEKDKQRAHLSASAQAEAQEIAQLAAQARDTRDLLSKLRERKSQFAALPVPRPKPRLSAAATSSAARLAPVPEVKPTLAATHLPRLPIRRFSESRGQILPPVIGRVADRYGGSDGAGGTMDGIRIFSRDNAEVVAPFDGKLVFAGRFGDYGELLILEVGEGYHILLSGMSHIYGETGQNVIAGEPIGRMGSDDDRTVTDEMANRQARTALYVEFRKDGEPFNPAPWIAASKVRVSG